MFSYFSNTPEKKSIAIQTIRSDEDRLKTVLQEDKKKLQKEIERLGEELELTKWERNSYKEDITNLLLEKEGREIFLQDQIANLVYAQNKFLEKENYWRELVASNNNQIQIFGDRVAKEIFEKNQLKKNNDHLSLLLETEKLNSERLTKEFELRREEMKGRETSKR